jgi:hypothetical protein
MKNLPAREKLDIVEKVAQYLVLAASLDKGSPIEDYDRANELSLELAMLLPGAIYRAMVEAAARPNGKVGPGAVALLMRNELIALDEGGLNVADVALHGPALAEKPRGRAH